MSFGALSLARIACIGIGLLLCPALASAQSGERDAGHALTAWSSGNGLPLGDIFAIAQDSDGQIWLGTLTGLIRFDGFRFSWVADELDAELPPAPVNTLVGAADGSLWVGFGGEGGIWRIHQGAVVRHAPRSAAPVMNVHAMMEDRSGAIWVASRTGLFHFAQDRWTSVNAATGYPGGEVFSLYEDRAGILWIGAADGVYRRQNDRFELVDPKATHVRDIAEDLTGTIWVTDSDRVLKELVSHRSLPLSPDVRLPTDGWQLLADRRGRIWSWAFGGGLMRVDLTRPDARLERVQHEHRLGGSPRSLFEDRDGNIWVGLRGGLLRFSEAAFDASAPLGQTYDGARTAAVGKDGSVWVATSHVLNEFTRDAHRTYDVPQTLALHADRHGRLWISTKQDIKTIVNGRVTSAALPAGVASNLVMGITTDAEDTVWLCTSTGGVLTWTGERAVPLGASLELLGRPCRTIYTDQRDRVWIGLSSGGLVVRDRGRFLTFNTFDGLTPGTVLAILEDSSGSIWISTSTGLNRYRDGELVAITRAHAPIADPVPVLIEDAEGFIWVGINAGSAILRIHPSEADKVAADPSHQVRYRYFDEADGMHPGSQTWQAGVGGVRGPDGRLWVATGSGMAIIDPRELPPPSRLSPPRIDAVSIDGRRIAPDEHLRFPSSTSTIAISYGAIDVTSSSKLRLRHMLEGADVDWVYTGSVREAMYAGLRPGEYRFRIASTYDGEWTDGPSWSFVVTPPFYRTPQFLTLAVFSFLLVVGAAWWLRLRAVRRQYALVLAERTRVSREIHDTLLQSLAAIGVELETIATELGPQQSPAREALRRLRHQVGHSVREARDSILGLRQQATQRTLVEELRDLASETTSSKGVPADVTVTGRQQRVFADAQFQLVRIAQEAVSNAVRHAGAARVRIVLTYEPDWIVLTISDDGRGFRPEEVAGSAEHLGLLTMRERAERVRGRFTVHSMPGGGTTIEARVPVMR